MKCSDVDCCGELRSDLKMILENGFLPPPLSCVQDPDTGRLRALEALENVQGAHFLSLFQAKVVHVPIKTTFKIMPYDFACPTVQGDVEPGRRICKVCLIGITNLLTI